MTETLIAEASAAQFTATVERQGPMCFIKVPFDVKAVFGKARPPVLVTINDHCWPSTVAVYGGESYLPLRKSNREAAKLEGGEVVEVLLVEDTEDRTVEIPKELVNAFAKDAAARTAWAALSFSHQREHAEAIEGAKKDETRLSRVAKTLAMLKGPKKQATKKPASKTKKPPAKKATGARRR